MKRIAFVLALFLALTTTGGAQEIVTLGTPVTKPSQTTIQIERITIDVVRKSFYIQWTGNNGEPGSAVYSTPVPTDHPSQPTGSQLLTAINKMNFANANPSFVKRILTQLVTDGYVAGIIGGTVE